MSTHIFEAQELVKTYDDGRVQALRGVSFHVERGEFVAIMGPSGCGKTTLLHLLGALDRPNSGTLLYSGKSIPELRNPATYRACEIGFVFQAFHLLPAFTALENVQLPMFERRISSVQRWSRARALLQSVGMEHRLNHFPAKLSGGEKQRVAIARSLANGPAVLLADEPTGNLDSENSRRVMELLVQLHRREGMTLVLVTHDPAVARHATRTVKMKDGRIVPARKPAAT